MTDEPQPRPSVITSAKLPNTKELGPWEYQDRLGRNKLIKKILKEFSGTGGNTTEHFQKYEALVYADNLQGFDNAAELAMLNRYAKNSGDVQGKNKSQIIQVIEEKGVLFPGAGGLYPAEQEEKIGFFKWLGRLLFGTGG